MSNQKKVLLILSNILLAIMYIAFAYCITSMFEPFPWYSEESAYLVSMAFVWIPLCIVTLFCIILRFCFKHYRKSLICIACLNAIYIPGIFGLGFLNITLDGIRMIGICALFTMSLYFLLTLIFAIKDKNEIFDFTKREILLKKGNGDNL